MHETPDVIGEKIRQAREKLGLSQAELASKVGVSQAAISQFEKGSARPSLLVFIRLSRVLGLSMEQLITEEAPHAQ